VALQLASRLTQFASAGRRAPPPGGRSDRAVARAQSPSNIGNSGATTIKLTLDAQTLSEGQTISGFSFVASVTDSAGRSTSEYAVCVSGADGGYCVLDGVKLLGSERRSLTAAQFARFQYVAGSTAGTNKRRSRRSARRRCKTRA
jgi:hypothetical protein